MRIVEVCHECLDRLQVVHIGHALSSMLEVSSPVRRPSRQVRKRAPDLGIDAIQHFIGRRHE